MSESLEVSESECNLSCSVIDYPIGVESFPFDCYGWTE